MKIVMEDFHSWIGYVAAFLLSDCLVFVIQFPGKHHFIIFKLIEFYFYKNYKYIGGTIYIYIYILEFQPHSPVNWLGNLGCTRKMGQTHEFSYRFYNTIATWHQRRPTFYRSTLGIPLYFYTTFKHKPMLIASLIALLNLDVLEQKYMWHPEYVRHW